jgi:exopolyphosphatase/guanosine-5'-triphosphate,3'-diphosphate pyrophosphatase
MFAAVDLGSNSFRLHIGFHDGTAIRVVKTARDPIRLGAGLDSKGNLTEAAIQDALRCLRNFKTILDEHKLDAVRVVATNTLRIAKNTAAFLPLAEEAIGHPIEIISGEEEGRLIYMGVASTLAQPNEKRLVIDIGGGSTELILGCGPDIRHVESFSIGTVKQSLSFFSNGRIDAASFDAAILSARSHFEDAAPMYDPKLWANAYGSSGTIRAISDVISKNGIGDGTMSYKSLVALKARLIEAGNASRFNLPGIKPERVIVMVGGLAILIGIMQELGMKSLTAINAGLRVGVLWDLQLRADKHDRRDESAQEFVRRFHADESRALRVANIAVTLFNQLKPSSDSYSRYLYWSGLMHEVGLAVSHTGYHKHAAYMVENADLPGFTTGEQRLMSTLILAQKGNLRKIGNALSDQDFAKAVLSLRLATMLMHSKTDSDIAELRLKMKNRIEVEARRDWIAQHPTVSYWMEKERDSWDEIGVEFVLKTN